MIGPADSQAQFKSSSSLQCLSCFNLSGKPPPLSYQPECQPATTKRTQKHARRGKMQKQAKLSMVIIVIIIRNDDHGSSYGHYIKMMSMVII
jgi:hypothetical protein